MSIILILIHSIIDVSCIPLEYCVIRNNPMNINYVTIYLVEFSRMRWFTYSYMWRLLCV